MRDRLLGFVISIALICGMLLTGCAPEASSPPSAPSSSEGRITFDVDGDTLLAFSANATAALFDALPAEQAQGNPCFSPLSLYLATSLCALGSDGQARDELLEVLGMESLDDLEAFCEQLSDLEEVAEGDTIVRIANSLWIDDDYAFREAYATTASEALDATLRTIDFADAGADALIDEWVSSETNGLVQKGIQTTPETIAALVSTLYLKDGWLDPFDPDAATDSSFAASKGPVETPFLSASIEETPYLETPAYTAAALETQGGMRVAFFLPIEGTAPESLLSEPSLLLEMLDAPLEPCNVAWSFPAFTASSSLDSLQDVLSSLGVRTPFDPERTGSFASMIEADGEDFYVNRIAQGSEVALDAFGIEAASATIVEMVKVTSLVDPSEPVPFVLDRPFAFTISSAEDHLLFIGVVNDPLA